MNINKLPEDTVSIIESFTGPKCKKCSYILSHWELDKKMCDRQYDNWLEESQILLNGEEVYPFDTYTYDHKCQLYCKKCGCQYIICKKCKNEKSMYVFLQLIGYTLADFVDITNKDTKPVVTLDPFIIDPEFKDMSLLLFDALFYPEKSLEYEEDILERNEDYEVLYIDGEWLFPLYDLYFNIEHLNIYTITDEYKHMSGGGSGATTYWTCNNCNTDVTLDTGL
jgi:hypothetical protein